MESHEALSRIKEEQQNERHILLATVGGFATSSKGRDDVNVSDKLLKKRADCKFKLDGWWVTYE